MTPSRHIPSPWTLARRIAFALSLLVAFAAAPARAHDEPIELSVRPQAARIPSQPPCDFLRSRRIPPIQRSTSSPLRRTYSLTSGCGST